METERTNRDVVWRGLLDSLHEAEDAVNAVYPCGLRIVDLEKDLDHEKGKLEKDKSTAKTQPFYMLVAVVMAFVGGVLREGRFLSTLFLWLGILLFVISVLALVTYPVSTAPKKKKIGELEQDLASAEEDFSQITEQHSRGLRFFGDYMPKDCMYPPYARVFVEYFERGRAQTIPDGWSLFEEYMHREKMEGIAQNQLSAVYGLSNIVQTLNTEVSRAANAAERAAGAAELGVVERRYRNNN